MIKLYPTRRVYMEPTDGEPAGGGAVDRGDDFVPTGDDATEVVDTAAEDAAAKAAAALEAEIEDDKKDDDAEEGEDKGEKKEAKPKGKDSRLPLARHKEILDNERAQRAAVEAELAKYKQGAQIAATNEDITAAEDKLTAMEVEYQKLVADGELKDAAAKMKEIRTTERAINDQRTGLMVQAAQARAVEQVRYDTTVERIEEAYPALNQDHDDYDKAKMTEVMELQAAYRTMGMPPAAALQKAVKTLMPAPETRKQEVAVAVEARVASDDVAKQLAKDRKTAAVAKNIEASGKQPPATNKVGLDSDKTGGGVIDAKQIMKMDHKAFSGLNEETLARARGDIL